jgi:hypothetical protein
MHPEEENIIKMANQLSKDLEKDNSYRKIINQVSNEVYIQET